VSFIYGEGGTHPLILLLVALFIIGLAYFVIIRNPNFLKIRGADRIDCSSQTISMPTCNGTRGRNGLIFCDIYAAFTGSRIAYGGCYDRNDNLRSYCDEFHEEEKRNRDGWTCQSICANYDAIITKLLTANYDPDETKNCNRLDA
jgi:hypothetical protein